MTNITIFRIAANLSHVVLRIVLNPNLPELIQIVLTIYDFASLFIPYLPQIPE